MDNLKTLIFGGITLAAIAIITTGCVAYAKSRSNARPLSLFAFNYTDRAIIYITVDGMWLGVADAYTNSGSAMGPMSPRNRKKQHTIEVTWEVSGLYDLTTNTYSRMPVEKKSAIVPIKFPYPENPRELILHFYPDGHVEAEMIDAKDRWENFRRFPVPKGHKYNDGQ